jgi:hypothetical protein
MTPDSMVTVLKMRLLNSNDSSLDADIITLANVVQERLEQMPELPWFLFIDTDVEVTNLSTTATVETLALPSNYLREVEDQEYGLFVKNTDEDDPWVGLWRDEYSVIKKSVTGSGRPSCYDILKNTIYLRKIPDAIYTMRLLYFKRDDDIAAGTTENDWMTYGSDWIMAEVGLMLASTVVALPDLAAAFKEEAQRAQRRIKTETIARVEAGMIRQMGDD